MSPGAVRKAVQQGLASVRGAFRAKLASVSGGPVQRAGVEGLQGEPLSGLELFQQFGFTSAPPGGTSVIVVPLGGRTSASVIVATEAGAYRLQLGAQGEVAIYNQWGDSVWLKQGGEIAIKASTKVEIDSPLVHIKGALKVDEDIIDNATTNTRTMGGMRSVFNAHTHPETNAGSTSTPNTAM